VAVTARSLDGLGETAGLVEGFGRRCVRIAQDVRDVAKAAAVVEEAGQGLGGLDILINNAGYENVRASLDVDEALWDSIVDTNLKGAFFVAQAAARLMAEQGRGGSIVNLCSLTSFVGIPTAVPYGASKTGLLGMTRALASEWAQHGIRVNAIAPGYFRTAMTDAFYRDDAWRARMLSAIPQGRFGEEGDLDGAVVFLCSDAAAYVTGHCIPVDGGFLASI
jgi:NAD(P)-dependent dehydrogenase (short-subunit alcohol dehydrogenase family)